MSRRAVVLLSGGLDSTTVAAMARERGFELFALSIDYGQRHQFELTAACRVAATIGVARHAIVRVDLSQLASSALTDANIEVPKHRTAEEMDAGIPVTYVPARNTVFLTLALGWAEVLEAADIFLGVNALDYSGYPDCRPEYIAAFERLAGLATKAGVEGTLHFKIHTPLIEMTKAQIIQAGAKLGVDYGITHSCYDPEKLGRACGQCDACLLRLRGFAEAGLTDPIEYSNVS